MRLVRRLSVLLAACFGLVTSLQHTENAEDIADISETVSLPLVGRKGYPQLFTHKTSSLLTEALQMLHRAKDVKERRWLEAFVHRLAILANDLEKSTVYLKSPTAASSYASHRQHTVPTTGQISPPPSPSDPKGKHRSDVTTQETLEADGIRELGKPETATSPNFPSPGDRVRGNDVLVNQLRQHYKPGHDDVRWFTTETYSLDSGGEVTVSPTTPVGILVDKAKVAKISSTQRLTPELLERDSATQKLVEQVVARIQKLQELGLTQEELLKFMKKRSDKTVKTSKEPREVTNGGAPTAALAEEVAEIVPPPSSTTAVPEQPSVVSPRAGDGLTNSNDDGEDDEDSLEKEDDNDDELVRQLEGEKFQTVTTNTNRLIPKGVGSSWETRNRPVENVRESPREFPGGDGIESPSGPAAAPAHSQKSRSVSRQDAFLIDRALNALKRSRGAR